MKLVATKLEMETVGKMSRLVIENVEAIASDLTVLDSRLLLGNANIDVVALDGTGSLVLIAIDRSSDEQLLLKAVEAYSWCLEYPDAVRRLYPGADVSVARPPRVMFVVERMSDSFHRKVKQLGFPEVDCVEFRHLAIDGAEAVHFDTIVRLRRATLVSEDTRPAAPVAAPTPARDHAEPAASTVARATSVKLQKLLTSDTPAPAAHRQAERPAERPVVERPAVLTAPGGPTPAREPGVVVSMMNRAGRHAAVRLEEAQLPSAPQAGLAPAAKPPLIPAITRRPVRDAEPTLEPLGTLSLEPAASAAPMIELVIEPRPVLAPVLAPVIVPVVEPEPIAAPEPVAAAAPVIAPVVEPEPIAAPVLAPVVEPEPIAAPEPVAVTPEQVVEPQPIVAPEPGVVAPSEARVEEPVVVSTPPAAETVIEPVEPARADAAAPPRISFADLSRELFASQAVDRTPVVAAKPVAPTRPLEPPASIKPANAAGSAERLSFADLSKELLGAPAPVRMPQANGPTPMRLEIPPVAEPPQVGEVIRSALKEIESAEAEPVAAVLEIAPVIDVAAAKPVTVASLVEAAAQAAPAAAEAPQEPKTAGLPQGFEGLKFPGDGVLTRQWMDFLNQMTATK